MAGLISVVVPNRDGAQVIEACLAAVFAQTAPAAEVILVDDASTDGSDRLVERQFPAARLIRLGQPAGFAGACNAGISAATGEWVALLNSDAVPEAGWLAAAREAGAAHPTAAMIASRVLSADGLLVDSLGLSLTRGGLVLARGHGRAAEDAPAEIEEVFGPAGSAAFYRRAALLEAGGFTPDYFAYYEDAELAWRLRRRGLACLLAPAAVVRHRHSHTVSALRVPKRYYLQRNRLRTIVRCWPGKTIARCLPRIIATDLASLAAALGEGSFLAALRARLDFCAALPRDLSFRRQLDPPAADLSYWLTHESREARP